MVCYLAFGFSVLPVYGVLVTEYWNRRKGDDVSEEEFLESVKPCRGYFDPAGGCWQDESYIAKFPWDEAYVEYDASAVTISFWGSEARFYLPSRFFASPDDYQRLRIFLHKKYRGDEKAPEFTELAGQPFDHAGCMSNVEVEQARSWGDSSWPFERTSEAPLELTHQPKWSDWSLRLRLTYFGGKVGDIVFGWLTLHLAYLCWLAVGYYQASDWSFFWGDNGARIGNWFYFGFLIVTCFRQVVQHFNHRRVQNQFIKILFDASGSLTRQGDHFVWVPFSDQMRLISNEDYLGWEIPGEETLKAEFARRRMTPEFASELETLLRSTLQAKQAKPRR